MGRRRMMSWRPADPGGRAADEDLLMQRLAEVVTVSSGRATTSFKRRRSSGLLFQIRRRMRRAGPLASFMPPGHPPD
ncbi:MAG TPA: hypothetical protein VII89_08335 [Candidatus Dormibacteraeota bacterium]